ncbi:hypothetical protein MMC10_003681 [Thelotrema lepadinum]|nr:hypothetical protein [Thelotrema lepadinum]
MKQFNIAASVFMMGTRALAQTDVVGVMIPAELSYLLPEPYQGDINANFIDTTTQNSSVNAILAAARNATFYAYDQEFYSIGSSPSIRVVPAQDASFAHEAGVWASDYNQVWFTTADEGIPYAILDLDDYSFQIPSNSSLFKLRPNLSGGTYFNGTVYFAAPGTKAQSLVPAVYSVDPLAGSASTVLNSYYGIPLNSVDDLAWVLPQSSRTGASEANLFFTTLDLGANNETEFSDAVLPNAVFRYTPSTKSLQAVISRADILAPNGISADPSGKYLYVSDTALTALTGPGSDSSGSTAVYRFDLDEDCLPVNKRLVAIPRSGVADGMHADDYGRIWTAEFNGIVVRDSQGRELGVFNGEQLVDEASAPIRNFALAGDKLVILGGDSVSVIQLAQNVTTPAGNPSRR